MPTLTPDPTQPLPTSLAQPANGDVAYATQMQVSAQAFYDAVHRLGVLVLANAAALTAVVSPINGERFYVSGYGFFEYRSGSSATVDNKFVINGPAGVGRQVSVIYDIRTLGLVPNQIVKEGFAESSSGSVSSSDVTWQDFTTLSITNVAVGDILHVEGNADLQITGNGSVYPNAQFRVVITDGTTTFAPTSSSSANVPVYSASVSQNVSSILRAVATLAATHTIKLQYKLITAGAGVNVSGVAGRVKGLVLRP